MIKKVLIVCVALTLVAVLVGVAGGAQIGPTNNQSTATAPKYLHFQSGPFVGSKNSNVYHYPSCYHVKQIKPENLVYFNTVQDACAQSYRPCKDCNPPPCGASPTAVPTATPTAAPTAVPTAAPTAQPKLAASPTHTSTPTQTPTSTPTTMSSSASNLGQASSSPSKSSTPGFEAVYAIGALAAAFVVLRVKRRS